MMSHRGTRTAVLEIDLNAIRRNYDLMRSLVARHVAIAAVVKSNAYGLGIEPVADILFRTGCRHFFVADADEAIRLRATVPDAWIAVLQADFARSLKSFERHRLTAVVNSIQDMALLNCAAPRVPLILNIETGVARLGMTPDEARRLHLSGRLTSARIEGIMSHLACADQRDNPANEAQRSRFEALHGCFPSAWASLSATAGLWLGERYHFDMVRLGSALYGQNTGRICPNPLHPVVTLRAPIVHVQTIAKSESVGYGATFHASRETRLATVAIGYRHGIPWSGANKIRACLGTSIVPVVGRISMEYLTVDVTDVPEARSSPGNWIELLNESIGVDDLATAAGTVAQELVLRLGGACRREYRLADPSPTLQPSSPRHAVWPDANRTDMNAR